MTDSELALELERQPSDADGLDLEQLPATLKEQDVDELLRGDPQATATGERRARTRRPPNSPRLWVYRLLNGVVDRVQRGPLGWALFSAAVAVVCGKGVRPLIGLRVGQLVQNFNGQGARIRLSIRRRAWS